MAYRAPLVALSMLLLAGFGLSCGGSINSRGTSPNSELLFIADNCQCLYPLIRSLRLDTNTGKLAEVAAPANAMWARPLIVDSKRRFLYAGEIATYSQAVLGYSINATSGQLTPITGSPFFSQYGGHNIAIDASGRFLYADNQGFAIDQSTGALTPINNSISPAVITKDGIGLNFSCPAINGPGTLSSYRIDASGNLLTLANVTITCIDGLLTVDPTGRFIYVDQAIFALDPNTGNLTQTPGSFPLFPIAFDPQGKFMYGGDTNGTGVNAYQIDRTSGVPTFSSGPFSMQFGLGQGVVDPSGHFFVTSLEATYAIDQNTGALTPIQPAKNLNTTAIVFYP